MAGPIGHGVSRALREARDQDALAPQGKRRRPPRFPWWILITALVVAGVLVAIALLVSW